MPIDSYKAAIDWLFQQFPSYQNLGASAYKPGLENTETLCRLLGNPEKKLRFVHIAGSNGKGSTASLLASILTESGYKTGLFTSPHLVDFTERIRINGRCIDEEFVVNYCRRIQSMALPFSPSFFEITWGMALLYFEIEQCDICIIETGLGGRLDSTNVITPLVSVITNISLEHTQFLGNTLSEIAFEKAGIIKEGIPVVIGQKNQETEAVFRQKAASIHAPIHFATEIVPLPAEFPLLGEYQKQNFATVLGTLTHLQTHFTGIDSTAITSGCKNLHQNTGFAGRLQVVSESPRVVLDVSHNADGIAQTLQYFDREIQSGRLKIVYGSSSDKDFDEIFPLFPKNLAYFFTEFSNVRSAQAEKFKHLSKKNELDGHFFSDPLKALENAKQLASSTDTILVFGSFFLIHDFLK